MDILEELALNRAARAENILKGFNDNDIEKAHNVGDIHPNGKWVWTQLSNGKYDWRVIKNNSGHNSGHNADNKQQLNNDLNIEKLSNGMEIRYKNIVTKQDGNVVGLKLNREYYAELYQDGKRIDWYWAEEDAKDAFDKKIKTWRDSGNSAAPKNVSNNTNSKTKETKEQWLKRATKAFNGYDGSSKWDSGDTPFGRMRISYTTFRDKKEWSVGFITPDGENVSKEVNGNMYLFGNSPTAAKKCVLKYLSEHYDDYVKEQSSNDSNIEKLPKDNKQSTLSDKEKEVANLIDSLTRTSGNGEIVYSGKYKGKDVVITRYKGDALWNVKIDGYGVLNDKSSVYAGGLKKFTRDAAFDYVVDKLNNDANDEKDEAAELQKQQSALFKEQNKTNDTLKYSLDKWLGVPDNCSTEVVGVGDKCVYKIKTSGQPFVLLALNDDGEIETTINTNNVQGKDGKAVFNTLATLGAAMSSDRYGDVLRAMQDCFDKQKKLHDEIAEINKQIDNL